MIKPKLPAKAGFVEVEIDGYRKYKNIETGEIISFEELSIYKSKREKEVEEIQEQLKSHEEYISEMAAAYTQGVNSI